MQSAEPDKWDIENFYRSIAEVQDFIGSMNQHQPGAKLDEGKPKVGLVMSGFAKALMEVSKVGTYGAGFYSPNGWKEVEDAEARYTDAMMRHYMKETTEGPIDKDSGQLHAAQVAWNALARLHFILEKVTPNGAHY